MALFRRRRGLSFNLLTGEAESQVEPAVEKLATVRGKSWIAPRSDPVDGPFYVSGTPHRQESLAKVGSGQRLFRLVRDPDNPYDPNAVKVMAGDVHIGFITAKNAGRYCHVIDVVEASGCEVFVHGEIRKHGNQHSSKWVALIDCAYPNEWPV